MSSRILQYSTKSPRSVTAVFAEDLAGLPSFPPLEDCKTQQGVPSTRSLQKLHRVASLWRSYSLDSRNRSQRRRNSQRLRKTVSLPTASNTVVKEFDPESSVLSLSNLSHECIEDAVPETPWYEQEYQELPWWEYPDLDEDDEITVLCKQVVKDPTDAVYLDRVEALVWTAAVKLQNVARFVLQAKEHRSNQPPKIEAPLSPRSASKALRVEVPAMFVGLPKEVQAEKRRYKRAASADTTKASTKDKPQAESAPVPVPVVIKPRVRTIRRIVSKKEKEDATITPTPVAAWVRTKEPEVPAVEQKKEKSTQSRIQDLKARQIATKQEQERRERQKMEQKEAAQRLEAQQRRLERLKNRSMA